MRKYLRMGLVILLMGSAFSCSNRDRIPGNVIGMKRMSNILLDMQEAEVYSDSYMDTAYKLQSREERLKYFYVQILSIHNIDKEKFMASYHFYESHPDLLKKIYARMQTEIDRKKDYADSLANVNEMRRLSVQRRNQLIEKWNTYRLPFQQFTDSIPVEPHRVFRPKKMIPVIEKENKPKVQPTWRSR